MEISGGIIHPGFVWEFDILVKICFRTMMFSLVRYVAYRRWRCAYHRLMAWIPPGSKRGTVDLFIRPAVAMRLR
jgi:hypothetical protein